MKTLSENAKRLNEFLKQTDGAWDLKCAYALFPPVEYPTDKTASDYAEQLAAYFQYAANLYGCGERNLNDEIIHPTVNRAYASQTSDAYQELRKAGMAGERNSGYNDYFFYPKNK